MQIWAHKTRLLKDHFCLYAPIISLIFFWSSNLKLWLKDIMITDKTFFFPPCLAKAEDQWPSCLHQLYFWGESGDTVCDQLKTMQVSHNILVLPFLTFHWTSIQSHSPVSLQNTSAHLSVCIPFHSSTLTFNICCLFKMQENSLLGEIILRRHVSAQSLGNNELSQYKTLI